MIIGPASLFALLAVVDVSPDPALPSANHRQTALDRALREPLGSPSFYEALNQPDLSRAAANRILGRQVMMVGGTALLSAGLFFFIDSIRGYKLTLYGNSGHSSSPERAVLAAALLGTGGALFGCGAILRKDPLDAAEREQLLREYRDGDPSLASVAPYAFVVEGGAAFGLRGRF